MSKSILIAVLSALLLILGCGGSTASTPVVIEKEVIKEVVKEVIVVATPIPTMVPVSVTGPTGQLIVAADNLRSMGTDPTLLLSVPEVLIYLEEMYDFLVDLDFEGSLIPSLATDWELSSDQLTWTFTIREGVEFHDGSPLTAEDVAYSWNRVMFDPESAATAALDLAPRTESVTAVGNKVVLRTKQPEANGLLWTNYLGSGSSFIITPKDYIEDRGTEFFRENPVGTGPYRFEERIVNQYIKMTASDQEHWRKEPGFKDLTIMEIPELTTRSALLRTGGADIIGASIASKQTILDAGLKVISAPSTTVSVLIWLNIWSEDNPFHDPQVREAMSIAIDRQTIADRLYLAESKPSANMPAAPGTVGFNPNIKPHPYDLDRAKQLMKDAGYPDGFKVAIHTYINDADFPALPNLSEAVLGYLQDLGITGEVKIMDDNALNQLLATITKDDPTPADQPYPLYLRGNDARYHTLRWINAVYHSQNARRPWTRDHNTGGSIIPWLDEAILKAQGEFDTAKQEEIMVEYSRRLTEEYWHAPLLTANAVFGLSNRVESWKPMTGRPFIHNFWTARPAAGVK
jgi:peptide/nickel transport system substrate-binding protein